MAHLTEEQIIQRLRKACVAEGTQRAFADKHNLCRQIISDILRGDAKVSDTVARALKCRRKVVYEEIA